MKMEFGRLDGKKRVAAAVFLWGMAIWAAGCGTGPDPVSSLPPPSSIPPDASERQPGIVVRGSVRLADGRGLAGVDVFLALASYGGRAVAVTDSDGTFQSPHQFIPGDEMIRVWGEKEGYVVQPADESAGQFEYYWRHSAGSEERELHFVARPVGKTPSPTTTSFVGHPENESMLYNGVFRITVTMVGHLSNAMWLALEVENISDRPAEWSPAEELGEAYVLDGDRRLEVEYASGIFSRAAVLEAGAGDAGQLVFPLAREDTFRFYYPACEPAYVILRPP
jgi:hypothetical protein